MNLRRLYVVAGAVLALQLAVALWGLTQEPAGQDVPIHWGLTGEPDGFASPLVAFLLIPVTTVLLLGILAAVPRIEPRRGNLERSSSAFVSVGIALLLLMAVLQVGIVLSGVGVVDVPMNLVVGVAAGALFVVIGNVMTTVRSNFMFGVRTPWTLTSELSWRKTHRLVGWLFVAFGLGLMVASIVGPPEALVAVILVAVGVILVVSFVYSYRVWKTDPDRPDRRGMA
jgi:uncharacterized membrane protein